MPAISTKPKRDTGIECQTYTLIECADIMGISYRHAMDLATEGSLPGVFRMGRKWLVSRSVVAQMLADPASTAVSNEGSVAA